MESSRLKSLLETLIFVAETPLKVGEMVEAVEAYLSGESAAPLPDDCGEGEPPPVSTEAENQLQAAAQKEEGKFSRTDIQAALLEIERDYAENPQRGILLSEVAGGWQFRTRPENSAIIRGFYQTKPTKLTKPSLETLAIVAYRQPITRVEIDAIRGVDSGGVLKTLLEKNLLRIVGKKDEPGKPMLYGTTQEFLELFQLKSLKDMPTLKEFRELEEEFQRKAGAEGTVVENIPESEELGHIGLDAAPAREALTALEDEEEHEIVELEESLQGLRKLEREIFAEPGKPEGEPPPSTENQS